MARARREKPEPEEDEEEDDEASPRDFVMARLAASRALLTVAITQIDEAITLFVDGEEDKKGEDRSELVDGAEESCAGALRALESAGAAMEDMDGEDWTEGEPWEDEE